VLNELGKRMGKLQQQVEDLGRDCIVGVGVFQCVARGFGGRRTKTHDVLADAQLDCTPGAKVVRTILVGWVCALALHIALSGILSHQVVKHTGAGGLVHVADQLQVSPGTLSTYLRPENRWKQIALAMEHLGFRRFECEDEESFVAWLGERVLEDDRQSGLLRKRGRYSRLVEG
jgi:hypothetical protein